MLAFIHFTFYVKMYFVVKLDNYNFIIKLVLKNLKFGPSWHMVCTSNVDYNYLKYYKTSNKYFYFNWNGDVNRKM